MWSIPDSPQARTRDRRDAARPRSSRRRLSRPSARRRCGHCGRRCHSRCPARRARRGARPATSGSATASRRPGRSGSRLTSATRMPRACPRRAGSDSGRAPRPATGRSTKLGSPVDPQDGGAQRQPQPARGGRSALTRGGERGRFALRPLDAALVAVGQPALLRFSNDVSRPERRLSRQPAQQHLGHELHDVVRRRPAVPLRAGARVTPAIQGEKRRQ